MFIVLPLLSALSSMPAIASSYSSSEKRTLQSAISSALHSAEINRFYQQCKEPAKAGEPELVMRDKSESKMLALLQERVGSQNIEQLLAADNMLTRRAKSSIVPPKDCMDGKGLQVLMDSYEVALFSLEISMPIENGLRSKTTSAKVRSNAEQNAVKQLIASSHAIALVSVTDKNLLNAVQQANYLHPDYASNYVFKVQYGWRSNISQYLGMHIQLSEREFSSTAKEWLIFLDKNGHFIKAIASDKAKPYLSILLNAEWRYDIHGNLLRN